MAKRLREMGKLRQIVEEATGLQITHVHDDLVFVENSVLLLQFDDSDFDNFFIYFVPECDQANRDGLLNALKITAKNNGMHCSDKGQFRLTELPEKAELVIEFL